MSATALPLPLELTEPVALASDLDTQLRESFGVGKYDPKMQVTMWYGHGDGHRDGHKGQGGSRSTNNCQTISGILVVDAQVDIQADDAVVL